MFNLSVILQLSSLRYAVMWRFFRQHHFCVSMMSLWFVGSPISYGIIVFTGVVIKWVLIVITSSKSSITLKVFSLYVMCQSNFGDHKCRILSSDLYSPTYFPHKLSFTHLLTSNLKLFRTSFTLISLTFSLLTMTGLSDDPNSAHPAFADKSSASNVSAQRLTNCL